MRAWKEAKQRRSYVKAAAQTKVDATVEVGLEGRHEALALMTALIPFHSFVVQHDLEHWVVHARAPGCHDETLDALLATIERWTSGVDVDDFTCVVREHEAES